MVKKPKNINKILEDEFKRALDAFPIDSPDESESEFSQPDSQPDSQPESRPQAHYFQASPKSSLKIHKLFDNIGGHSISFQTSSGVFGSKEIDKGTRILLENIMLPELLPDRELRLLDIGAGYGPISLWLSKDFDVKCMYDPNHPPKPIIYASEVNKRAVWLLNRNIVENRVKNITVLKGDFCDKAKELKAEGLVFDAIYTNPPIRTGHEVMLALFENAMELLSPTGFIQYVHKKKLGAPGFISKLQDLRPDWHFVITKKKAGYHLIVCSPVELDYDEEDPLSGYF